MEGITLDAEEDKSPLPKDMRQRWQEWNLKSLDGLPGLLVAPHTRETFRRSAAVYKKDEAGIEERG